jgi:choline kinase
MLGQARRQAFRYSLANLHRAGIDQAIIVVGYQGELVRQELGIICEEINVTYLENSEYQNTGSMYSMQVETGIEGDILLLESDLFYEPRAIEYAKQSPEQDLILVAAARGTGNEVYVLAEESRHLIELGKHIAEERRLAGSLGFASGISAILARNGGPMWIGEFGAFSPDRQSSLMWTQDVVTLFNTRNIGWTWWAYTPGGQISSTPFSNL